MKAYSPMMAMPSAQHPSATEPNGFALALRRVAIAVAGLAVAGLAAAACVLSFDDLRILAVRSDARPDLAYLYPATFDALLVIALIAFLLLRTARLIVRLQAGLVLLVLLAAAGLSGVAMAAGMTFDVRQGAIVLAILPWAMLAIGLWLLLLLVKHAQARRAAYDRPDHPRGDAQGDIVPFDGRPDRPDREEPRRDHPDLDTAPVRLAPPHGGPASPRPPRAEPEEAEEATEATPGRPAPSRPVAGGPVAGGPVAGDPVPGGQVPERSVPGGVRAGGPGTGGPGADGPGSDALGAERRAPGDGSGGDAPRGDGGDDGGDGAGAIARKARESGQGRGPVAEDVSGEATVERAPEAASGSAPAVAAPAVDDGSGGDRVSGGPGADEHGTGEHGTGRDELAAAEFAQGAASAESALPAEGAVQRESAPVSVEPVPAAEEARDIREASSAVEQDSREGAGPVETEGPTRPIRWGDLVRGGGDDVLVHPGPAASSGSRGEGGSGEAPDTQDVASESPTVPVKAKRPRRQRTARKRAGGDEVRSDDAVTPEVRSASGLEGVSDGPAAEVETGTDAVGAETAAQGVEEGGESARDESSVAAPPSSRVRSTPRPPVD